MWIWRKGQLGIIYIPGGNMNVESPSNVAALQSQSGVLAAPTSQASPICHTTKVLQTKYPTHHFRNFKFFRASNCDNHKMDLVNNFGPVCEKRVPLTLVPENLPGFDVLHAEKKNNLHVQSSSPD